MHASARLEYSFCSVRSRRALLPLTACSARLRPSSPPAKRYGFSLWSSTSRSSLRWPKVVSARRGRWTWSPKLRDMGKYELAEGGMYGEKVAAPCGTVSRSLERCLWSGRLHGPSACVEMQKTRECCARIHKGCLGASSSKLLADGWLDEKWL